MKVATLLLLAVLRSVFGVAVPRTQRGLLARSASNHFMPNLGSLRLRALLIDLLRRNELMCLQEIKLPKHRVVVVRVGQGQLILVLGLDEVVVRGQS